MMSRSIWLGSWTKVILCTNLAENANNRFKSSMLQISLSNLRNGMGRQMRRLQIDLVLRDCQDPQLNGALFYGVLQVALEV